MQIKNISPVWVYTSQFAPIFAPLSLSDALCLLDLSWEIPLARRLFSDVAPFP